MIVNLVRRAGLRQVNDASPQHITDHRTLRANASWSHIR